MFLLVALIGYLVGCFSSAYLVGKLFGSIDIREHGSGNSGATNALRVLGLRAGALTFILDVFKGIISSYIGYKLYGHTGLLIGGLFSVIGHNWPVFLDFKGGKGVATSLGVFLMLNLQVLLVSILVGIITIASSRYVSLGSMVILVSYPFFYFLLKDLLGYNLDVASLSLAVTLALMTLVRHKSNIERIISGKENKLGR